MARPIGRRVIEVCEVLEKTGPTTSRGVAIWTDAGAENCGNYCMRATAYGFTRVDKQRRPFIFEVLPNWRELLAGYNAVTVKQLKAEPKPVTYAKLVNSVFDTVRFL